jgi:hypothetical protein
MEVTIVMRHDHGKGQRFAQPVAVTFARRITPSRR